MRHRAAGEAAVEAFELKLLLYAAKLVDRSSPLTRGQRADYGFL